MIKELREAFGISFKESANVNLKHLPMYMVHGRTIRKLTYGEYSFIVVSLTQQSRFGAVALQKQLEKYREISRMDVAYAFESLTRMQRDVLIRREIPFICLPNQIYLPFLGILLNNAFRKKSRRVTETFMPATQSLFLYLLYNKGRVLKKDAADYLGLTRTSITRASEQLVEKNLIKEEKEGTSIYMAGASYGREQFEQAKECLVNPVQKIIYARRKDISGKLIIAGESALSRTTMLGDPNIPVYAIYKGDDSITDIKEVDPKWEDAEDVVELQLWKYDPALFATDGVVDIVSLYMSLENETDERIEGELSNYLEEYAW